MANSVNTQIILDGPRNAIIKVEGILDTSDLATVTIADPANFMKMDSWGLNAPGGFLIQRIQYDVEPLLECRLAWDATIDVRIAELTGYGTQKYECFGGLPNNSGAGRTGKILLSTQGWSASAVLSFTLVLHLIKQGTV